MAILATIEEMKVVLKTGCYRDFHIKYEEELNPQNRHLIAFSEVIAFV
ncbi:hypothetical protein MTBBW1_2030018 [Desulfamplus magnetovallimortis]|uniref:Uncharacterized protein n=1 Tax=Desulfamplus magnetovallimortis TaxID=1246637 RepID=A0A1W1HC25_9BACT|nr:hypothetical protein MTBBW1_2030018 [Desulfamplus magnetovallimortis]